MSIYKLGILEKRCSEIENMERRQDLLEQTMHPGCPQLFV